MSILIGLAYNNGAFATVKQIVEILNPIDKVELLKQAELEYEKIKTELLEELKRIN